MGFIAPFIPALAALVPGVSPILGSLAALTGIAGGIKGMTGGGGGDQSGMQQAALRAAISRRTPDMLAQTGGGASPQFLANLGAQEAGLPGREMDALKLLGQEFPGLGGGV